MIYKLIDPNRFLQGLPMLAELDDSTLNEEGKKLLEQAVAIGIYAVPPSLFASVGRKKNNVSSEAASPEEA